MAATTGDLDDCESLDALFTCLASGDRRHLLGVLHDRASGAPTRRELATALAARDDRKPRAEVTDAERERAVTALRHVHLPAFEDAELIDRTDEGVVVADDHPAFRDPGVRSVVTGESSADGRSLDALFDALADARRRTVLDVLSHQYHSIRVETLATDVVSREADGAEPARKPDALERAHVELHHTHLPKLQDVGLIEFDADEGVVEYRGHPDLRAPWMHSYVGDEFRATLSESPSGAAVWDIDGWERIVSCGQSICEEADEELFLLFTATGLLEAGCFARIARAVERGVDVYLGTRDPTVREFVRETVPEVTLWEPETDWLNLPVAENNVGRLVFADREAAMVATLGEKTDDGSYEEQAILGEGEDNALVGLLRQMLGSRLDQFDDADREVGVQL